MQSIGNGFGNRVAAQIAGDDLSVGAEKEDVGARVHSQLLINGAEFVGAVKLCPGHVVSFDALFDDVQVVVDVKTDHGKTPVGAVFLVDGFELRDFALSAEPGTAEIEQDELALE